MAHITVITISREYGAGGGETAQRLAGTLGWQLLDQALIHAAATVEHLPDSELEKLDEKAVSMVDRFRLHPPHQKYLHGIATVAREAAAKGQVVLVGRGTRQLLGEMATAFHLRLVAPIAWRAARMARLEGWTQEQAHARCLEVDRTRERFIRYFFGAQALLPEQYDLVVNSARVPIEEIVAWVVALVRNDWPTQGQKKAESKRVLTLARQLGAGDSGFAPTLAARLGLRVYDRDLLEQEAVRLGIPEAELEKIDEQPAGIFQRFRPGSLQQRYIETLGKLMRELAKRGNVLLVGRGGSRFLQDMPGAVHIRLVAPLAIRVQRVMAHRWVREEPARQMIIQSDECRRRFYQDYFGADWTSPLEYHLTINSGRLGATAVDLAAYAAERLWQLDAASPPTSDPPSPWKGQEGSLRGV